ncbi:MAG: hypothetical protein ACRDJN_05875, partial [Chloroflexota bacterium]
PAPRQQAALGQATARRQDAGPATAAPDGWANGPPPPTAPGRPYPSTLHDRPEVDGRGGARPPEQPPGGESASLSSAVDLSLERAQALERYTHGLLSPLVTLLREREAALERREEIVRQQAERIGRLEREVELLRAQLARAALSAPATGNSDAVDVADAAEVSEGVEIAAAPDIAQDEVVALASQVARLRGDLRQLAVRLEERTSLAPASEREHSEPCVGAAASHPPATSPTRGEGEAQPDEAPARAELPAPLVGEGPGGRGSPAPLVEETSGGGEQPTLGHGGKDQGQATGGADGSTPDPFAQAEAAIHELQQALLTRRSAAAGGASGKAAAPAEGAYTDPPPGPLPEGAGSTQATAEAVGAAGSDQASFDTGRRAGGAQASPAAETAPPPAEPAAQPPADTSPPAATSPASNRRPWWQFWRRR